MDAWVVTHHRQVLRLVFRGARFAGDRRAERILPADADA